METINKKYIADKHNNRTAVQVDIKTFEKIEEILENYSLLQLMEKNYKDELLNIYRSLKYYQQL